MNAEMERKQNHLKALYEALRKQESPGGVRALFEAAEAAGIEAGIAELQLFGEAVAGYAIVPEWVSRFIALLMAERAHATILDPLAGVGSLIGPLVRRLRPEKAVAVCTKAGHDIAVLLNQEEEIVWLEESEFLPDSDIIEGGFDLVVASLPAGGDYKAVLNGASVHIGADGTGIFLLAEDVKNDLDNLPENVFVDTVLTLGEGLMVILKRQAPDHIFAGRLSPEQGNQDILARNIALRREGRTASLGVLMQRRDGDRIREAILECDIRRKTENSGADPVRFGDVALSMAEHGAWKTSPDAVYVPPEPTGEVSVSRGEAVGDAAGWLQVVLERNLANPAYIAAFLNTDIGRQIRSLACLRARHTDRMKALADCVIYLPDRQTQDSVMRVQRLLAHMRDRVGALERDLMAHPYSADRIQQVLDAVWHEDDLDQWIETLPFPLASILWAYNTAGPESEHRIEHLFHFFEAYAEFSAVVLISAIGPLCVEKGVELLEHEPYFRDSYRFATFRAWIVLGRRLAHHTRTLMSSPRTRKICIERFGNPDPGFLELLTHKRIFAILDDVANMRNLWKAHGGVLNGDTARERCLLLEEKLAGMREHIGQEFASVMLLSPGLSRYSEGIFSYRAQLLRGSHMTFRDVGVETTVPMEEGRLYLLYDHEKSPLVLLPLIRLTGTEAAPLRACYFYNRIEGDKVRWVSYHYSEEAEQVRDDPAVIKTLEDLGLIRNGREE